MAVAYDTGSANSVTFGNVSSVSFNVTVGAAGSNRLAVVNVSQRHADTLVTGVDFDSAGTPVAMTVVASVRAPTVLATDGRTTMYRLVAPATGTRQVTVSFSPTDTNLLGVAGGEAFTGVDQTTPVGTPVSSAQDTTATSTVTVGSLVAGDMVAAVHTVTGAHTLLALDTTGGAVNLYTGVNGNLEGSGAYIAADAASETITYTWTSARIAGLVGVALLQAAAGAGGPFPHFQRCVLAGGLQLPRGGMI